MKMERKNLHIPLSFHNLGESSQKGRTLFQKLPSLLKQSTTFFQPLSRISSSSTYKIRFSLRIITKFRGVELEQRDVMGFGIGIHKEPRVR